jgi:hypothetical protein
MLESPVAQHAVRVDRWRHLAVAADAAFVPVNSLAFAERQFRLSCSKSDLTPPGQLRGSM